MKRNYLIITYLFLTLALQAQDTPKQWNLEECINYAIEHNINIKQFQLQKENAEIRLNTAKMSRLPNLNANLGQGWNFGRTNNNQSGVYVSKNTTTANTSMGISSSIPLFTGFQINNEIAKNKLDLEASTHDLEKAKEDLSLNIASMYLQTLFNKEIHKISKEQLALSMLQVERTKVLVESGKVPKSQLIDIKAQIAKDEVTVTDAKNKLDLALLDLAQGLELERASSFDVEEPEVNSYAESKLQNLLSPTVVYDNAINIKPLIKVQESKLESSKKSLKIAQADYYPRLNLNMSYNNSYFYNYKSDSNTPFSEQFKNNGGEYIGLSLSIPIFNRFQVRNQVSSAKLSILSQQLELENTKKTLYKEIQTAYLNATASHKKFDAADRAVDASSEAFKYAQERYEAGGSSVYELNEAKTKLIQSQSERVQAKYEFIFRTKILDFYNGIPITL